MAETIESGEIEELEDIGENEPVYVKEEFRIDNDGSNLDESIASIHLESQQEVLKLHEKNVVLQELTQSQGKLIELLTRMDLVKSCEDPDKREMLDLDKKINMFHRTIEEFHIKLNEINNNRRRELLTCGTERRAAIWDNFSQYIDNDGHKFYQCHYCGGEFLGINFTLSKCKDHLYNKCPEAQEMKRPKTQRVEHYPRSSVIPGLFTGSVWDYFTTINRGQNKEAYRCTFCDRVYSNKNATKCREHLALKCLNVTEEVRQKFQDTFSNQYLLQANTPKKQSIWEHFEVSMEDDKVITRCIYCGINYANKNATKCREHLLERCEKVPIQTKSRLSETFTDTSLKCWTQVKIPMKNYFTQNEEKQNFQCNYCQKEYSTKNVTKFRSHLINKCIQIPAFIRKEICDRVNSVATTGTKRSFDQADDDDDEHDHGQDKRQINSGIIKIQVF